MPTFDDTNLSKEEKNVMKSFNRNVMFFKSFFIQLYVV